jgi:hypothetical protein
MINKKKDLPVFYSDEWVDSLLKQRVLRHDDLSYFSKEELKAMREHKPKQGDNCES